MTGLLLVLAALLTVGGLFSLGIWTGLGMAEDRARQAASNELWRRARARAAARATLLLKDPPAVTMPAAGGEAAPLRLPGYAEPFPRPGRLAGASMNMPHAGTSRPSTSPVDLDPGVRRTPDEPELYVAALIARTRHAERKYT